MNKIAEYPEPQAAVKQEPARRKYLSVGLAAAASVTVASLAVGVLLLSGTFTNNNTTIPDNATTQSASTDAEQVITQLGTHMLLPESEHPVVASIKDVEKLQESSAFYKNAENGDRLIVFPQTKKAVIFSTDDNIIVNSGLVVDTNN